MFFHVLRLYCVMMQAETSSYSASDMCGSPAIDFGYRDPGFLHKAQLTDLQPGLTYYYTCGDQQYGWSQEFSFTAALAADPKATVRVSAFGGGFTVVLAEQILQKNVETEQKVSNAL